MNKYKFFIFSTIYDNILSKTLYFVNKNCKNKKPLSTQKNSLRDTKVYLRLFSDIYALAKASFLPLNKNKRMR